MLALAGSAAIASAVGVAHAGTIRVDPFSTTGGPGCTLRDAITAANLDRATGRCSAGSDTDTIELPTANTIVLSVVDNPSDAGPNGLPVVTSAIIVDGNGSKIARSDARGTPAFRILEVAATGSLTLNDVTVTNGRTPDSAGLFVGGAGGGGIVNSGTLVLDNCTISGNRTGNGGQEADGGSGGGIFNRGTLTLVGSTVSQNAAGDGEAQTASAATAATAAGGGIFNAGTVALYNSTVSGNSAGTGGAQDASEVRGGNGGDGGGIYNNFGMLTLTNTTITGNSAGQAGPDGLGGVGGGIAGGDGTFVNTILAGNSGIDCWGAFVSEGHSVVQTSEDCMVDAANSDITGQPALLGPLQDNSGPTATHALLAGSPAIDAGDDGVCLEPPVNNHDQRGLVRPGPHHLHCSIGAYEPDADPPEACAGDCDTSGNVSIDELLVLVNIALGAAPMTACPSGDMNGDGAMKIDEIIAAVKSALDGCPLL